MPDLRTEPTLTERIRGAAARRLRHLPGPLRRALTRQGAMERDGHRLDPTIQAAIALRPARDLMGSPAAVSRARFRRELIAVQGSRTPVGSVEDLSITGAESPLRARHYRPAGRPSDRLTVYCHGGGFVLGDLDTHDEACRLLCAESGHQVLSVEYRLAPEHQFPAAVEDALASFRWAVAHAPGLGADPARLAVAGDSAGANLAALVARLTRGDPVRPAAQLLIYPPTDRSTARASHELFDQGLLLSMADVRAFHELYVGASGTPVTDPRISPVLAPDLAGLPPALVVIAGFDVLRDEGEAYAAALAAAGTPVTVLREPSLPHGFVNLTPVSPAADRAVRRAAAAWKELLG